MRKYFSLGEDLTYGCCNIGKCKWIPSIMEKNIGKIVKETLNGENIPI